jgi:tripeptide aminopeptidase
MLEKEMRELGLKDVSLDEHGYLFGTLPANLPAGRSAPVIGLLAHVDTYGGTRGDGVKPQVIERYSGGDLVLPGDPQQVIRAAENPQLARCIGHTLVTTDGTTLLGADDKAGVATIMTALEWLLKHPELQHGALRIGFTPDEEIGAGTKFFDVARFGAKAAYTLDGSLLGEIENETFCADSATATITGFDCHPGQAKGVMINSLRAAASLIERLPHDHLPETTAGRESYLHPIAVNGEVGRAVVRFIVRGFTLEDLRARNDDLRRAAREVEAAFPGVRVSVEVKESYRNMKQMLDQHPRVVELAMEAVKRAGLAPTLSSIRGGTDGSALSFKGLPTPNIFVGSMNFHGVKEWVSLEWMSKSVETCVHLANLWGAEA